MIDNFGKYGFSFQTKIISGLITDKPFMLRIKDNLKKDYFETESLKWILENTIIYFNEYKELPTIEVFAVQVSNLQEGSVLRTEVKNSLREVFKNVSSHDLDFVKNRVQNFCKKQELKNALISSVDLLDETEDGNGDRILETIRKANLVGDVDDDFGLDYLEQIEYRYEERAVKERIKTGFSVLDDAMGGGLPKGKLGIVMAPTGGGKSWILATFGANALKEGKTVLHYTLELDDVYTAQRYDTILTNIPMDDLKFNQNAIKKVLSKYKGKLFIKEFPSGTLSLSMLESHIDKFILNGIKPDLVIIDYPELMKIPFNTNMRDDKVLGQLYVDLRGLAGLKDFAIWGADQTNRSGKEQDEIGTDSVSNAFAKMFVVDFMISFSRKAKDKINDTARAHIAKSRLGPDGITFPCQFDTTYGKFQIYNPETETGKKVKDKMLTDSQYEKQFGLKEFNLLDKPKTEINLF